MDIKKQRKSGIRRACEAEKGEKQTKKQNNLNKTESAAMLHGDGDRHSGGLNINLLTCSHCQCGCVYVNQV